MHIQHSRPITDAQQCHALVALDLVLGPLLDALPLCGHNPAQARRRALRPFPTRSGAPTTVCASEGGDHYPAIARWNGTHRVIECGEQIQWIVQRRVGGRWRNVSYHRDRDILIERCAEADHAALDILRALPGRHP